ncbi:hypothetical protein A6C57_00370 [Fibrella sp. ES10-3-2-2]|nr:hypothetical protein A6C57_00370 [Fibrella sp. ES10-3-2-2]
MPTETTSAWICRIQPDTAPAPAITDAGVFFVLKSVVSSATYAQEAEDALRLLTLTDQQKYLLANVTDIQVVDLTGGGGGSGGSGGTTLTAVIPLMEQIRTRYRQGVSLVDVGFIGTGEWRYKVARSPVVNDRQQTPVWESIAWIDAPSGTGERVLTLADYVQKVMHILLQSKTRPSESYEVRINCLPGNTQGYDWLLYAQPGLGLLDTSQFQVLDMGRTWREDLAITKEAGPTPDTINIRIKSGFNRDPNTRWFWWLGGVPLFDKADQDNFTVTVAKATLLELHRYITPLQTSSGELIVIQQYTATYYVDNTLHEVDQATIWTGTN